MPNARPSPQLVAARRSEIAKRYGRKGRRSPRQIAALRIADLNKLFAARYGRTIPDDDAGCDDIEIALQHLIGQSQGARRCEQWLEEWAPWMTLHDSRELIGRLATTARAWTADQLAWRVRLTMEDRTALRITTIGAIDCGKAQRTKLRKVKARERERQRRARLKAACAP